MANDLEAARRCTSLDVLRGVEGNAADTYFGAFPGLISKHSSDFTFQSRNRRPPLDPVNSLLSFLYSMLAH